MSPSRSSVSVKSGGGRPRVGLPLLHDQRPHPCDERRIELPCVDGLPEPGLEPVSHRSAPRSSCGTPASPRQQALRRVDAASERCGHLGHRQVVQVAERQDGLVVGRKPTHRLVDDLRLQRRPVIGPLVRVRVRPRQPQPAVLARLGPPVIDEAVAGHGREPRRRHHGPSPLRLPDRAQDDVRRQVLGQGTIAATTQDERVDVAELRIQDGEQVVKAGLIANRSLQVLGAHHRPFNATAGESPSRSVEILVDPVRLPDALGRRG